MNNAISAMRQNKQVEKLRSTIGSSKINWEIVDASNDYEVESEDSE